MDLSKDNSAAPQKNLTPTYAPEQIRQRIDFYIECNETLLQKSLIKLFDVFNNCKISVHIRSVKKDADITEIFKFTDFIRENHQANFIPTDIETDHAIDDSLFQHIFERRLVVRHPILLNAAFSVSDKALENVAKLSKYGLFVVFNLYLENSFEPSQIDDIVKKLMFINYAAGFSVYPASHSLHPKFYGTPIETAHWLEILVDLYKNFPHYDVLFEPVNEIANITSFGGWNTNLNVPRFIKISVTSDGELRIFRQNPNKGVRWAKLSEISSLTHSQILTEFVKAVNGRPQLVDRGCSCFDICRGVDDNCPIAGSGEITSLECETRRFFIRAFSEQIRVIREQNDHESAIKE